MTISPDYGSGTERVGILAGILAAMLREGSDGHCARVDYLDRGGAEGICGALTALAAGDAIALHAFVLIGTDEREDTGQAITPDRAIEMRNRKHGRLCVFVPADLVDATISSLGNSFQAIDGRDLYRRALHEVRAALPAEVERALRAVLRTVSGSMPISDDRRLDLALAAAARVAGGTTEHLGRELWRVGLIADAGPDFEARLATNRRCTQALARPPRLDLPYRERIQSLKVDDKTAVTLDAFFAQRQLNEVQRWSRSLAADEGPTLDAWGFPDEDHTDLTGVTVDAFTNAQGEGAQRIGLIQPYGAGTPLQAKCGPKEVLRVKWKSAPLKPANVPRWQVALVPASDTETGDEYPLFDVPTREVKGAGRSAQLKMDLEFEEPPETMYRVRVVALDGSGNEIRGADGVPVAELSEDFFLTHADAEPPVPATDRRRTEATLAEGRLRTAMTTRDGTVTLTQPAWLTSRETAYFSVRANPRTILNLALSPVLLDLEQRTIGSPRSSGQWTLSLSEIARVAVDDIVAVTRVPPESGAAGEFWRERQRFFERLRKAKPRDVIEAAEWTTEMVNAARRYAQAYTVALDATTMLGDLSDLLSVDTLTIRIDAGAGVEEAVVVLPTHPLRTFWFASHAALLATWEDEVAQQPLGMRARMVDLDLVHDLLPTNMPAFVLDGSTGKAFLFFQNLNTFHAVAFPATVPDPRRRFADVARVLGCTDAADSDDDRRVGRLAAHLRDFLDVHPYADPLRIALLNPDRGQFVAAALEAAFVPRPDGDDDGSVQIVPALDLTGYTLDTTHSATLVGLNRLRYRELQTRRTADYLQPAVASAVTPIAILGTEMDRPAHLAIVSDLSEPTMRAVREERETDTSGSLSLHGLIARWASTFRAQDGGAQWRYGIVTASRARLDPHPVSASYTETLVELQTALLRATGRTIDPQGDGIRVPTLDVRIRPERRALLERLHADTDWVITLDRFWGVEFYDSPRVEQAEDLSRKYLLDYSPEFIDGLGHRMIVTTASRDEVAIILRRAMEELGFATIEQSVRRLLEHLKTVSGRLALQALSPETDGTAAVGLGAVIAWLHAKRRLQQGVIIPIDAHLGLFGPRTRGAIDEGQRRCDLALIGLRRNIVEATFIEVKWRRGPLANVDALAEDMMLQMRSTARTFEERFFNPLRADGALQRANLANVLRFYCARAQRYGLLDAETARTFVTHLAQLEKEGLDFRPSCEGYIVSLEDGGRREIVDNDCRVAVLTAADFEQAATEFVGPEVQWAGEPSLPIATASEDHTNDEAMPPSPETHGQAPADHGNAVPEARPQPDAVPPDAPVITSTPTEATPDRPVSPDSSASGLRVMLGESATGEVAWQPSIQGSPHLFITGIPGQGKSVATAHLLTSLARQRIPAFVFDFHGQFADAGERYVREANPLVIDAAEGLPFSPFACTNTTSSSGWNATALAVSEIFAYVSGLGDIQRDALYTCVRDAYRTCGFGAANGAEPDRFPTLNDVLRRVEQAERNKQTTNLVARCRPLLEMDVFRPPADNRDGFADALRRGLVIDLHHVASEMLQMAAGAFLLRKLYRDMFQWGYAEELRLVIVLDEAHRLARDITLPKIMKEGRKFGVAVVVASQGIGDFHADVLNNAGTKIAFRANHSESRKIAGFFRARGGQDLAAMLEGLGVGQAIVQTPEMPTAVRVRMQPPDETI